jgi:hypothetical protein
MIRGAHSAAAVVVLAVTMIDGVAQSPPRPAATMTFFVTSTGPRLWGGPRRTCGSGCSLPATGEHRRRGTSHVARVSQCSGLRPDDRP